MLRVTYSYSYSYFLILILILIQQAGAMEHIDSNEGYFVATCGI